MSQISSSSVAVTGGVGSVQSSSLQTTSVGSLNSLGGGSSNSSSSTSSVQGSSSVSRSTQTLSLSTSRSTSLGGSATTPSERLAAMVMALIDIVLGLNDKDKDNNNKLLAGLMGLLAMSGGRQSGNTQVNSLEYMQSSQVIQTSTTTNVSAVQASSYTQAGGGVESATTGGNLNVVA